MTPPRRRFRFSIRMMLVFVSLVGVYFGSWPSCKDRASTESQQYLTDPEFRFPRTHPGGNTAWSLLVESTTIPYVVAATEVEYELHPPKIYRHYYIWCFGHIAKLPYKRQLQLGERIHSQIDPVSHAPPTP